MNTTFLRVALIAALALLCWNGYRSVWGTDDHPYRNSRFPECHLAQVNVDVTSPYHYVTLSWEGPGAEEMPTGPFRSTPGAGCGTNDCNDPIESNCPGSNCTPKGTHVVEALWPHLPSHPQSTFATVIDARRAVAIHAFSADLPLFPYPASAGCVRMLPENARLIFENSIVGVTKIVVEGTWRRREDQPSAEPKTAEVQTPERSN